jgi:hypothetical protein
MYTILKYLDPRMQAVMSLNHDKSASITNLRTVNRYVLSAFKAQGDIGKNGPYIARQDSASCVTSVTGTDVICGCSAFAFQVILIPMTCHSGGHVFYPDHIYQSNYGLIPDLRE